ncbi:YfjI family protein [Comamonas sp. B-9]|uniref:YfjI family protein n=1 Tax=Comamonas sp. B-9 TaxID=1055192 RepID=UPI00040994C8|nr:YfjI family protein [Comamonas sp. B-9]
MNAPLKSPHWSTRMGPSGFKLNQRPTLEKQVLPLELSLLDDIVKEIVDATSAPPELTEATLLGAMSIACQHLIDVDCPGGGRGPTSLFLLSSADSGERKSTIENFIFKPIFDIDHRNRLKAEKDNQLFDRDMMVWKAKVNQVRKELDAALRDSSPLGEIEDRLADVLRSKPTRTVAPRFIYRDESIRNLQIGMATSWPSAALVASESTGLFSSRNAESLPSLSAIWDGRPIDVGRAKMPPIYVPSPRLTISLMLQPLMIRGYLGKQTGIARISGLLARFWVVEPLSTQGSRQIHPSQMGDPKNTEATKRLHQRLLQYLEASTQRKSDQRTVVRFSPQAQQIWLELYNAVESELGAGGSLVDVKDCASKIANIMSRIAALIHYSLGRPGDIDVKTALYARTLSIKSLNNFKQLFGIRSHEEITQANAMRLNKFLTDKVTILMNGGFLGMAKSLNGEIYFEKSELENGGPLRPKALLDDALAQLAARGVVALTTLGRKNVVRFSPQASAQLPRSDAG